MKKRSRTIFLALAIALALCPTAALAAEAEVGGATSFELSSVKRDTSTQPQVYTATPTNDALTVNGVAVDPTAYKINDENHFKLRDIACLLNGTSKQFDVGYDQATQSATITTGHGYAKQPTDLQGRPASNAEAYISSDPLFVDGAARSDLTVYKINGANYFRLRDLGDLLGFRVDFVAGQGVILKTDDSVQPDGGSMTAEVVRLVNVERAKEGLRPLETFDSLDQAAAIRAAEIVTKFSHDRPDGSSCFTALEQTGAKAGGHTFGENIAAGHATAAATVEQWMNSPGHRANILNKDYTHIGVGYVSSPGGYHHYWVQMFVGKQG